jgi:ABC-type uncharacterized transport system permease subunit
MLALRHERVAAQQTTAQIRWHVYCPVSQDRSVQCRGCNSHGRKARPSGRVPEALRVVGAQTLAGVPINIMVVAVLAAIVPVVLGNTTFGRRVYMVGGNPRAAELVGVNVDRVTIVCYVASSILAGIGGLVLVDYVDGVDNWVGRAMSSIRSSPRSWAASRSAEGAATFSAGFSARSC